MPPPDQPTSWRATAHLLDVIEARKRGAVTALRMVAETWRGDHITSAAAVADDLTKFAAAIASDEVTLP